MITFRVLYIWTVVEITLCLSPASIVAIAKLHGQNVKAIASALNWKAKNDYKMALARSKLSRPLFGDRFIRNSDKYDVDSNNLGNMPSGKIENTNAKKIQDMAEVSDRSNNNFNTNEENLPKQLLRYIEDNKEGYGPGNFVENQEPLRSYENTYEFKPRNPEILEGDSTFSYQKFPVYNDGSDIKPSNVKKSENNINFGMDSQRNLASIVDVNDNNGGQPIGKKFADNSIEEPYFGYESTLDEINNEDDYKNIPDDRLQLIPFTPFITTQPSYQDPSYFDPSIPENKQDMIKFLDEQANIWETNWPKPKDENIHYNKPEEIYSYTFEEPLTYYSYDGLYPDNSEYISKDKNHQHLPDTVHNKKPEQLVPKPPLPTVHPVAIAHSEHHGHDNMGANLLNFEREQLARMIERLHEQGEVFINVLRPLTSYMDTHHQQDLERLHNMQRTRDSRTENDTQHQNVLKLDNAVPTLARQSLTDNLVEEPYLINSGPEGKDEIYNEAADKEHLYENDHQHLSPGPPPILHHIETAPSQHIEHEINLLNIEREHIAHMIKRLQEHGDLLFDMLRPLMTHMDSHNLHELEHIYNLQREILPEDVTQHQNVPETYVGEPLQPPDNHFKVIPTQDLDDSKSPIVGHIIQVPNNYYNRRFERSASNTFSNKDYINVLIEEARNVLNFLKEFANNDEDVMVLGNLGEGVLNDLKLNVEHKMKKRSIPASPLFMDPSTKIDVSKTFENLGTLAKTIFDHQDTPMYHVRNLVGSTKDALLATLKIPNQNIIAPSGYNIIENPNKDNTLVDEIPNLSSRFGEAGDIKPVWPHEIVTSTFQQVGQVIRDSVRSSQEAINHVGEITNHAKKAIYSAKNTPDLIIQSITPLPFVSATETVGIKSRFGDDDDDTLTATEKKPEGKFINVGTLLDAFGISNPIKRLPKNEDDGYFNKILKNINENKGVIDIHDYIVQMKDKLREMRENNPLKKKDIQVGILRFRRDVDDDSPFQHLQGHDYEDERVGFSFIPQELTHPFLNFQNNFLPNSGNNGQIRPTGSIPQNRGEGRTAQETNLHPVVPSCFVNQYGVWSCPTNQKPSNSVDNLSHHLLESILGSPNPYIMKNGVFNTHGEHFEHDKNLINDNYEINSAFRKAANEIENPFIGERQERKKFYKQFQPGVRQGYCSNCNDNAFPYYK